MRTTQKIGGVILTLFTLQADALLEAHEDKHTHPALSVGAMLFLDQTYPEDASFIPNSARMVIRQGSIDEDECPNFLSHFYDPKTQLNTTPVAPFIPGCGVTPSDFVQQTAPDRANDFWTAAIEQYRSGSRAAAFRSVGRILHLLEDMTSPAHVHNDVHAQIGLGECADADDFENWGWSPECGSRPGMQHIYDYFIDDGTAATWGLKTNLLIGLEKIFNNQPQSATPAPGDKSPAYTYVREVANKVYDFTTFAVTLTDTFDPNDRGDGELKHMFPSLEETTVPAAWWIANIGYSQGQCSGPASNFPQDWWLMSCTTEGYCGSPIPSSQYCVVGMAYIENTGGGSGQSYEIPDNLFPAQYDREWFKARYGSKYNSGSSRKSMLHIYGDILYPAAVSYGAGLLQAFLDAAIMPRPIVLAPANQDGGTVFLKGQANAGQVPAVAWFEWGAGTNYGNVTLPQEIGSGSNFVAVTMQISGLIPDRTYHYRIASSNEFGIRRSSDRMFQTENFLLASEGLNAWQIVDGSTAGGSTLSYITNLTVAQNQAATNAGWNFTVTSRLTTDFGGNKTMNFLYSHGGKRFLVWWDFDAVGDLVAEVEGLPQTFKLTTNGLGAKLYHTHEILYTNGIATYLFDGSPVTQWPGNISNLTPAGRVQWGSGSSAGQGQMHFHAVRFEIAGLGLVAAYDAGIGGMAMPNPVDQGWTRTAGSFVLAEQFLAPDGEPFIPIVLTLPASQLKSQSSQLNGLAIPNGDEPAGWFEWGMTTDYGNSTPAQTLEGGLPATNFNAFITGLDSGTPYHYRAVASNSFGVRFGSDQIFETASYLLTGAVPNAWQITDNSAASGSTFSFSTNLTVPQRTAAASSWRFTITSRLITDFGGSRTMTFVFGNGTRRYLVWWDLDANGSLTAELEGQSPIIVNSNAAATLYHTHELSYTNGIATYKFDGETIGNWTGVLTAANANQALWGSGSSPGMGQMNFQQVEFEAGGSNILAIYNPGTSASSPVAPNPVTQGWTANAGAFALNVGSIAPDIDAYLPAIETLPATAVEGTSAELNGQVSTKGSPTSTWFEWGSTIGYGNQTSPQNLGANPSNILTSAAVLGLNPGLSYQFRAVASNQWGVAFGLNQEFQISWFTPLVTTLPAVDIGSLDWGDFDNDGDLDVLVTGQSQSSSLTRIYRNNGNGIFTDIEAGLTAANWSKASWGDFDNDGFLDVLLTGQNGSEPIAQIYRNNSGTNFSNINAALTAVWKSAQAWFDFDNDGDLDALITGMDAGALPLSRIYRNDGGTNFVNINAGLQNVSDGSVITGDFDGDGDFDIVLTGRDSDGNPSTLYYRNDGAEGFSNINLNLPGVYYSTLAVADYDNDGDLDLLLGGLTSETRITRLFRNIRNGNNLEFEMVNQSFSDVSGGSTAWGDMDNDGHIDIALAGWDGEPQAEIYRNNGDGTFTALNLGLTGAFWSSAARGDLDNDGDLDLLITGRDDDMTGPNTRAINLYRNVASAGNTAPAAPIGLAGSGMDTSALLEWQASNDQETPAAALTYNLVVATNPWETTLTSPMADLTNGFRRIVQRGNVGENLSWTLNGLNPGTYYFTVQAIDSTFTGGPFAPWQMITVAEQPIVIITTEVPMAGQMRLQFIGPVNGTYEVWRSIDLVIWSKIGLPIEISTGLFEFLDVASPPPGAFYRIQSSSP